MNPVLTYAYFSKGLVQPPTRNRWNQKVVGRTTQDGWLVMWFAGREYAGSPNVIHVETCVTGEEWSLFILRVDMWKKRWLKLGTYFPLLWIDRITTCKFLVDLSLSSSIVWVFLCAWSMWEFVGRHYVRNHSYIIIFLVAFACLGRIFRKVVFASELLNSPKNQCMV